MDELTDPTLLRNYLLGTLKDESVQSQIEERLMVDEEFAARIGVIEDELIEEFLDGEMGAAESDRFNQFFLAPPERMRHLRLTRDLRRASAANAEVSPQPQRSQPFFSTGWLRLAAVAAVVVIGVLGVWRFAIYESGPDKGFYELRAAYRDQRPVESRVTVLPDYAPYAETRGDQTNVTDPAALDRAGVFFADATRGSANAAAHQGLAAYYLARGDLAGAEREMKAALEASPNDARIQNDAGAMYLEIARKARDARDDAGELIALNESLKHLERAVALDQKLDEAYFNRALALGALRNTEEAKAAWQKYLELDPGSKWADEAKQHLEKLERETPKERSAAELESDFLSAFRAVQGNEAEKLLSLNREPIQDKYLPVRLAMSFVSATDDRRDELRRALEYSGEIEMKLAGDPFAKEIALFYRNVPEEKWYTLREAHSELRKGFELCIDQEDFDNALLAFQNSRKTFDEAGDILTATYAQYFVGYAMANIPGHNDDALLEMNSVEGWASERNFSWLKVTALHWVASCLVNARRLTDARRAYEEAITIAERIGDSYAKQRNLSLLAHLHSICGQEKEALKYLFAAVKESDKPETSLRQRYRNQFFVFPILFQAGLFSAGRPAAMEVIRSADQQKSQMWMSQSRAFAGIAAAQMGDIQAARMLLDESRVKASEIKDAETRDKMSAFANLRSADFERSFGDPTTAEKLYGEALRYYDNVHQQPALREEAHQGLLLTYLATRNSQALDKQIPQNISLAEEYRSTIIDEDQTIGFFDLKANVYDIAAEFEFDKGNAEGAYNYAERSSSRALLDRMQRRAKISSDDVPLASPLGLAEIRTQTPGGARIVQYSVFKNKTVIWVIFQGGFNAATIEVDARDLSERVSRFSRAISERSTADSPQVKRLGAELHRLLIEPVLQYLDPSDELCIIPSKFLFDLPFAALIDPAGKPLISIFRLVHSPSANVFIVGSRNAAAREARAGESVLAVGNPAFKREKFEGLSYLPDSEEEAERISQLYPRAHTLLREEATKEAFLDSIHEADVVHFAGHYVPMPGTPMSSFLLLAADGDDPAKSELSNAELTGVALSRARLIVLAACRSGVESYYRSEGMAGMSRTMLAAQVPLVVASQWSVDSAGTAELMIRFHDLRQKQRLSTTAALRQAQLDLFNDPSGKFSSPYYWAAFAVYGGHARF